MNMDKDKTVVSFFNKISQIRDQLTSIGVVVDEHGLIQTAIAGIPSSRDTFLATVNGWEVKYEFEKLWQDCLQEEGKIQSNTDSTKEENLALTEMLKTWVMKPSELPSRNKIKT